MPCSCRGHKVTFSPVLCLLIQVKVGKQKHKEGRKLHLHCKATTIEKRVFGFMKSIANGHGRVSVVKSSVLGTCFVGAHAKPCIIKGGGGGNCEVTFPR